MTPFLLAQLHPRLWHVTAAEAAENILQRGLLTTADILDLWDVAPVDRTRYLTERRRQPVTLSHPLHGPIAINDNAPLNERKLAAALDDGLEPADWLAMLNNRVFFFPDQRAMLRLRGAALNVDRPKKILVIDTRSLAEAYAERVEIAPFNSGNTNHVAVRRGLSTFAPLLPTDYAKWQRRRGKKQPDTIREVAVHGSIPDMARFVIDILDEIAA